MIAIARPCTRTAMLDGMTHARFRTAMPPRPRLRSAGPLTGPRLDWRGAAVVLAGLCLAAGASTSHAEDRHLGSEHGCMACHGMVRKQVGPGFAQIAERYRNDPQAPVRLAGKIRNGSVGTWGRVIMPRQARITEPESRALALWVLSQPAPPP